jgi:hypothetical protein
MSEPAQNRLHPAQVLINLIVTLLAPMFLAAAGGNFDLARMAAAETIEAYRAETEADLIAIAQIIGFGLAALGSLSLSMEDNLSPSMTLRLRGNANACNRSAQQNRNALKDNRQDPPIAAPAPPPEADPDPEFNEAEVLATVASTRQRAEQNLARVAPAAAPAPKPAPTAAEQQYQAAWAAGAARVAAEITAAIPDLPPAERNAATIRAAALNDCANELLAGNQAPRPRPGDLAGFLRPNGI